MSREIDFTSARERMVSNQLIPRGIKDERVLDAMRMVPRHLFIPADLRTMAYADAPLPIGNRQTISQPYIVALMTELLEIEGKERILEIGTGSGYQAAILAYLAEQVYTVERISELAENAQKVFQELGIENIQVFERDGSLGLPEFAPFDAIMVTAAAPKVPVPLQEQLADLGRLVLPVGSRDGQILERWRKKGKSLQCEHIAPVAFVPLVGDFGWDSEEDGLPWWR
jgi:protein-L-isoaspartate(D-aspartate) O-methyltransferase